MGSRNGYLAGAWSVGVVAAFFLDFFLDFVLFVDLVLVAESAGFIESLAGVAAVAGAAVAAGAAGVAGAGAWANAVSANALAIIAIRSLDIRFSSRWVG